MLFRIGRPSNWRKRRIHFHDFMLNVHSRLQMHKGVSDPLDVVAAEISDEAIVLCLDEFMVFSTGVKYCSNLLIFMFVTCPTVPHR
jgi:predicted ATPase